MTSPWIKSVFWASALYDAVLGAAFLWMGPTLFDRFGVTPPNHSGYVQFPALLLLVFAVMFAQIALDPARFRSLIVYGVGLKAAYAGVVLFHQFTGGVPTMWIPFAYADLIFIAAFIAAWRSLHPLREPADSRTVPG